tara:strand:+ start:886 stop:1446 length:561 start_codon:yes stop_codon:yes gene_type:complete
MFKRFLKNLVNEEIDSKLITLNDNLIKSFKNIQKDMSSLREEINKKQDNSSVLFKFEQKLAIIEDKIESINVSMHSIEPLEEPKSKITSTQKSILIALYQLEKTIDQAISTKSLAKYYYQGRKYSAVRSTLSTYLEALEDNDLIVKRKLGKESYSETTNKGKEMASFILGKEKSRKKLPKELIENE